MTMNLIKGISRGAVVTMPSFQAWVCRFESPLIVEAGLPGRYINVSRCGGLSMALQATERPFWTISGEKRTTSWFRVSVTSRYDLSCWKRHKTPILLSFNLIKSKIKSTTYFLIRFWRTTKVSQEHDQCQFQQGEENEQYACVKPKVKAGHGNCLRHVRLHRDFLQTNGWFSCLIQKSCVDTRDKIK